MGRTTPRQTIPEIWTCGITDLEGFERIHTAALRATVIPGRLNLEKAIQPQMDTDEHRWAGT